MSKKPELKERNDPYAISMKFIFNNIGLNVRPGEISYNEDSKTHHVKIDAYIPKKNNPEEVFFIDEVGFIEFDAGGSVVKHTPMKEIDESIAKNLELIKMLRNKYSDKIHEILNLTEGWNGPNSTTYSNKPIDFALNYLALIISKLKLDSPDNFCYPELFPGPDAGLEFEWGEKHFDLQISIPRDFQKAVGIYGKIDSLGLEYLEDTKLFDISEKFITWFQKALSINKTESVDDLLNLIKIRDSLSLEELQDKHEFNTEKLRKKLHELIDQKKIKYSKLYRCPCCGLKIGLIYDLKKNDKHTCIFCNETFTLTDDNIEVYFFMDEETQMQLINTDKIIHFMENHGWEILDFNDYFKNARNKQDDPEFTYRFPIDSIRKVKGYDFMIEELFNYLSEVLKISKKQIKKEISLIEILPVK